MLFKHDKTSLDVNADVHDRAGIYQRHELKLDTIQGGKKNLTVKLN